MRTDEEEVFVYLLFLDGTVTLNASVDDSSFVVRFADTNFIGPENGIRGGNIIYCLVLFGNRAEVSDHESLPD